MTRVPDVFRGTSIEQRVMRGVAPAPRVEVPAPTPGSILSALDAAISTEWLGSSMYRFLTLNSFPLDPSFDPDEDFKKQLFDGIPTEQLEEFEQAQSMEHALAIRRTILNLQQARQDLASLGFGGTAIQIGAAILDPVALGMSAATGGAAGAVIKGARLSKLGQTGVAAVTAGATEGAITAGLAATDPALGPEDILFSALFGAGIGGAADATIQAISLRGARDLQPRAGVEVEGAMGAAAAKEQVFRAKTFRERILEAKRSGKPDPDLGEDRLRAWQDNLIDMMDLEEADKLELRELGFDDFLERIDSPAWRRPPEDPFVVQGEGDFQPDTVNVPRQAVMAETVVKFSKADVERKLQGLMGGGEFITRPGNVGKRARGNTPDLIVKVAETEDPESYASLMAHVFRMDKRGLLRRDDTGGMVGLDSAHLQAGDTFDIGPNRVRVVEVDEDGVRIEWDVDVAGINVGRQFAVPDGETVPANRDSFEPVQRQRFETTPDQPERVAEGGEPPEPPVDTGERPAPEPDPRGFGDFYPERSSDEAGSSFLRFDVLGRLVGGGSTAISRKIARAMALDALGDAGATPASAWTRTQSNRILARYSRKMKEAYQQHKQANPTNSMSFEEFEQAASAAKRDGALTNRRDTYAPDMVAAAQAADEALEDALNIAKRHRVKGLTEIEHDPRYLMVTPSARAMNEAVVLHGEEAVNRLFSVAIQRGSDLDEEVADKVAGWYVRNVRRIGQYNDYQKSTMFSGEQTEVLERALRDSNLTDDQIQDVMFGVQGGLRETDEGIIRPSRHRVRMDHNTRVGELSVSDLIETSQGRLVESYVNSVVGESAATQIRAMAQGISGRTVNTFEGLMDVVATDMRAGGASEDQIRAAVKRLTFLDKHIRSIPLEESTPAIRTGRAIRNTTHMIFSGGFGIASLPELVAGVGAFGVRNMLVHIPESLALFQRLRKGDAPLNLIGDLDNVIIPGGDWVTRRRGSIKDAFQEDPLTDLTRVERVLESGARVANTASGLQYIDRRSRQIAAAAATNRLVTMALDNTKPSAKRISAMGLTPDQYDRIASAIRDEVAAKRGLKVGKRVYGRKVERMMLDNWADQEAADLMAAGVDRWASRVVLRHDPGLLPMFMSKELGRIIFQFQSFHMASWSRMTLHHARHIDGVTLAHVAFSGLAGSLAYASQQYIRSLGMDENAAQEFREERLGLDTIALAGVQRGGASSLLPQAADFGWSLTGGEPLFNARNTQLDPLSSPATQILFKQLPSTIRSVGQTARGEEFSLEDFRRATQLLPGSRVLGFKAATELVGDTIGLESER